MQDDEYTGIRDEKTRTDKHRERGANMRALNLLDSTQDDECTGIRGEKTRTDKQRERGANMRALDLLDKHSSYDSGKHSPSGAGLTMKQAATLAHQKSKKAKMDMKAKMKHDQIVHKPPPKLATTRKESMAETTRKTRSPTEEDVRDPETVSGMKCQLDWDRQKEAQIKALKLLSAGPVASMA
jgi:hypothetical protein